MMTKKMKWILAATAVILTIAAGAFLIPYLLAQASIPQQQTLILRANADGTMMLSWNGSEDADDYYVEVFDPATENGQQNPVFAQYSGGETTLSLPRLPDDRELTIRVSAAMTYTSYGQKRTRLSHNCLEATAVFTLPEIRNLEWTADPESCSISVRYQKQDGDICRVLLNQDGSDGRLLQTRVDDQATILFGENTGLPMPGYDETYDLTFQAYREIPGLVFYGAECTTVSIIRDDLLSRDLDLRCVPQGYNVYTLSWNETKGSHYEVQILDASTDQWVTVEQLPKENIRIYTTDHLASCTTVGLRVVSVGGQTMEDSEFAAISQELMLETDASPIFCTVWPVTDLEAYADPAKTTVVGNVVTGQAYCVLEETAGMFGIRLNGEVCYIDSRYCMINLPEYLGDLCGYNITNSYASIYMVHEYGIPGVTNVVTSGYEQIRQADGSFLVPLLYPTAQKLVIAARSAQQQGYRLNIYDAYRPNVATQQIYALTARILDNPIPARTFTGRYVTVPEPEEEGEEVTYALVMTNNTWPLGNFLAAGVSLHNLGIALDLTLEDLETGKDLSMQTSMHDLSWYSITYHNNANAGLLNRIMKEAGFGGLVSEWWHFQDNDSRNQLELPVVAYGVNGACWMADDHGWRYRNPDGSYCMGTTVTIDDAQYTFDENGYVLESAE